MRTIILGAGAVGFEVARQLIAEGKNVVLIERDIARAKHASTHLDCTVLNEDGTSPETLKKAGIEDADFFIAVTGFDELNLVSCAIVASEFKVTHKIARVRNLSYSRAMFGNKSFLGADYIVTPELEAARQIISTVEHRVISDILRFEGTDIQVRNMPVKAGSPFIGKKLAELRKKLGEQILVVTILRDDEIIIPSGSTQIREGDRIYLAGGSDTLERVLSKVGRVKRKVRRILIVGAGTIGKYVIKYLAGKKYSITVVDNDYERCKHISEIYQDVTSLNGDISDESLFEEERLDDFDLIITLTGNQELNILAALYAKTLGVDSAIALIAKGSYLRIASRLDIDSTVSPKASSVDAILKYIRKGAIRTVHSIFDGRAEVIEYRVGSTTPIAGKSLKEITMPPNSLIVSAHRGTKDILPDGSFVVNDGDDLIVIATREAIPKIEKLMTSGS